MGEPACNMTDWDLMSRRSVAAALLSLSFARRHYGEMGLRVDDPERLGAALEGQEACLRWPEEAEWEAVLQRVEHACGSDGRARFADWVDRRFESAPSDWPGLAGWFAVLSRWTYARTPHELPKAVFANPRLAGFVDGFRTLALEPAEKVAMDDEAAFAAAALPLTPWDRQVLERRFMIEGLDETTAFACMRDNSRNELSRAFCRDRLASLTAEDVAILEAEVATAWAEALGPDAEPAQYAMPSLAKLSKGIWA